jgi:hypothetical protein
MIRRIELTTVFVASQELNSLSSTLNFPRLWIIAPMFPAVSLQPRDSGVYHLAHAPAANFDIWLRRAIECENVAALGALMLQAVNRNCWPVTARWRIINALAESGVAIQRHFYSDRAVAMQELATLCIVHATAVAKKSEEVRGE